MILPVGQNYRIRSDKRNWNVERRQVHKRSGEEYWTTEGHYQSPESAAVGLYELQIRLSEAEGWREATEAANSIAQELQEALSPHVRLLPGERA